MTDIKRKLPNDSSVRDGRSRQAGLQYGFSLIELMIAITISLIIVAALVALFVNFTRSNNELAKTNIKIENGRIAMQLLQNDIVHAGFWGSLGFIHPTATEPSAYPNGYGLPTAVPDPCLAVASWNDVYKTNLLAIPVQGFANGNTLTGCNVTGAIANSDVLAVSHANTCTAGSAGCEGGTDTGPHIQVSACRTGAELPYVIAPAAPGSTAFTLREKNCTTPVAALRKIISNIYYVASINNIPTLMRVSLVNGAWSAPQPMIEGIEAFRVEYGIDTLGRNGLPINLASTPANYGDGSADVFVTCPHYDTGTPPALVQCSQDELANVVAVRVHVLARNIEPTIGYNDTKSYKLGAATIPAANDNFKRHVFSTTVRLVNPSARREVQ